MNVGRIMRESPPGPESGGPAYESRTTTLRRRRVAEVTTFRMMIAEDSRGPRGRKTRHVRPVDNFKIEFPKQIGCPRLLRRVVDRCNGTTGRKGRARRDHAPQPAGRLSQTAVTCCPSGDSATP